MMKRIAALLALMLISLPSMAQWRVEQPQITSGAGVSASASYRLQGCIDHNPAGKASSASYTVYSGCGASAILLAGDVTAGEEPITVPTLSRTGTLTAIMLLAFAAVIALRRRAFKHVV